MTDPMFIIDFDVKNDIFNVQSNVKEERRADIISECLRSQIGEGVDNNEPNIRDNYIIELQLELAEYEFTIKSNTGNKGLTTGILIQYLKTIS